jgi:hypothetical protein
VRHDFGAERLTERDVAAEPSILRRVRGQCCVLEVLGADAEDHAPSLVLRQRGMRIELLVADRDSLAAEQRRNRTVAALERGLDHVHRGTADETADEQVDRPVVELLGCVDLLQLPPPHHGYAVTHGHRLDLVVGDVEGGGADVGQEARELGAQLHAQLRVQVRQRLVHQEHLRLTDDRAAHRHALALATREGARLALQELLEAEDPGRVLNATVDLVLRHLLEPQPEGDVVVDRQVRVERVALEDHGDVAIARGNVVDDALADSHDSLRHFLEAGDHAQGGRLAAAGRADEHHELPVGNAEVEVRDGSRAVGVDLGDLVEANAGHDGPSRLRIRR